MLSQVHELDIDDRGRCLGENDLAAVARRGDASGEVDVVADVALVGKEGSTGMQPDAHLDRAGDEHLGEGRSGVECAGRGREREEEGVALRVDLDTTLGGARLPDDAPMLCQRLRVGLGAELVQQLRRPLDVGEEEGHRAGRKLGPHRGPNHEAVAARGLVTRVVALA